MSMDKKMIFGSVDSLIEVESVLTNTTNTDNISNFTFNTNKHNNPNKITWLVQKLSELKYDPNNAVPFYFMDDVLVTILMCLICKKNSIVFDVNENQRPFKNMLEKMLFSIFGFSYSYYRCKPSTSSNDLITGILNHIKGKNDNEDNREIIGNSMYIRTEESLNEKKINSMPDLNKTPTDDTDDSMNKKITTSVMEINQDENGTNSYNTSQRNSKKNNLLNHQNMSYSNAMIKNIYKAKFEMEQKNKNSNNVSHEVNDDNGTTSTNGNYLAPPPNPGMVSSASNLLLNGKAGNKQDSLHKAALASEQDKEIKYNANTLSRLNLENRNNDFALFNSKELLTKVNDSIISFNKIDNLPNVIIIENMDNANYFVQDALLQMIVRKKLFNTKFPEPFIIISLISKPDIQNNVITRLLNNTFLYHKIKESISYSVPIYLSNEALITEEEISNLIKEMEKITTSKYIDIYIRNIMSGIRTHPLISSGIPVNSTKDLILATKALSALFEQTYITVDHIQIALKHVLSHRMNLVHRSTHVSGNFKKQYNNITADNVIADVLNRLPVK